jgi:hypothetical protein
MELEFANEAAREIIRQLRYYGNFDELMDPSQPDGFNVGAVDVIANGLLGAFDKRVEARLKSPKR